MKTLLKVCLPGIVLALSLGEAFGQYAWTKDARNPVFSGVNGTWSNNVFSPCVLFNLDSARYEMWFSANPGPTSNPDWDPYSVGFAVSNDGINWSMYPSPVLSPSPGTWDSFTIQSPFVLRENGQYKMWYSSYNNAFPSLPGYFGYATSPDGIHWTKYTGNPIFGPGTAAWEAAGPSNCKVIPKQGGYRMWFNGFNLSLTTVKIGYAESSDGVNWIRDTVHNPILDVGSTGQWDDARIGPGSVVTIDDSVYMWYTGNKAGVDGAQTGLAVSRDGITNWRKYSANPVLMRGGLGTWDNERAIANTVLRVGDTVHMWYEGWRTPYTSYQYRIGHATSPVVAIAGAVDDRKGNIPGAFLLAQNYPNPFNPKTEIRYEVSGISEVKITVYDLLGREVAVLVNERKQPGSYEVSFDASGLASGVYMYRMQAGNFVQSRRMLLLK
jgi:beta-1,2-mannobiose phosphorylase / 1,2-beta-oligomannan phosphorylase